MDANPLASFQFAALDDPAFGEDAVREEVIAPLLRALAYTPSGRYQVIRSKRLNHPYVHLGSKRKRVDIIPRKPRWRSSRNIAYAEGPHRRWRNSRRSRSNRACGARSKYDVRRMAKPEPGKTDTKPLQRFSVLGLDTSALVSGNWPYPSVDLDNVVATCRELGIPVMIPDLVLTEARVITLDKTAEAIQKASDALAQVEKRLPGVIDFSGVKWPSRKDHSTE